MSTIGNLVQVHNAQSREKRRADVGWPGHKVLLKGYDATAVLEVEFFFLINEHRIGHIRKARFCAKLFYWQNKYDFLLGAYSLIGNLSYLLV